LKVLLFPVLSISERPVIFGRLPVFTLLPFWRWPHADEDEYGAMFVFDPRTVHVRFEVDNQQPPVI
jgi:hypothetical protein